MASKLPREFYRRPTLIVAESLLGKVLVHQAGKTKLAGKIVETEAYIGEDDPACHARFGQTSRNRIMYGDAGYLYVYFIYGVYDMLNFVTEGEGFPAAVLIRALEPLEGIAEMQQNRGVDKVNNLANGPGKLCRALNIKVADTGKSLTGNQFYVLDKGLSIGSIRKGPRIGVGGGHDLLWRFYDSESKFISRK